MSKIAERLRVVKDALDGLLVRVYNCRKMLESESKRPVMMDVNDKGLAKILTPIIKRFPAFPPEMEKGQVLDYWKQKAQSVLEELEIYYHLFVDLQEFRVGSLDLIKEISQTATKMKWMENTDYMKAFLSVVVGFIKLQLLVAEIPVNDQKLVVAMYSHAYKALKASAEPSYNKIVTYVQEFESERKKLIEIFTPFASHLGEAVMSLAVPFNNVRQTSRIRKDGGLNLLVFPEKLMFPIQEPIQFELQSSGEMLEWILYCLLFSPDILAMRGAMELLKNALSYCFVIPVFRDVVLHVHTEFEALFGWYKSNAINLGKSKKTLPEASKYAVSNVALVHKERRVFLRQEMSQLRSLLQDKPGLFGPKIQVVLAALVNAKEEILFYLQHLPEHAQAPKTKAVYKEDDFKDAQISHLICLQTELLQMCEKYKKVVQEYHLEFLGGVDYQRLFNEWAKVKAEKGGELDPKFVSMVDAFVEKLSEVKVGDLEGDFDFEDLRMNGFRAEVWFSAASSPVKLNTVNELIRKIEIACVHSRMTDRFDEEVMRMGSLNQLFVYGADVNQIYVQAINQTQQQPFYASSFLLVANSFIDICHRSFPQEREIVGRESVALIANFLQLVALKIGSLVEDLTGAGGHLALVSQTSPLQAALRVNYAGQQMRLEEGGDKKKKPAKGAPGEIAEPVQAGMESYDSSRSKLDALRVWTTSIAHLCSSFQQLGPCTVYDTLFNPMRYIFETLEVNLKQQISNTMNYQEDLCRDRFSVALSLISHYVMVMKWLDNFCDIAVDGIVREVFLGHFYDRARCTEAEREELTGIVENPAIERIAAWFSAFITKKLAQPGVIFSPTRKAFVSISKQVDKFRAEEYVDYVEMKALATLVGPYGVRVIDREILKVITNNLLVIKDNIIDNKQVLQEFSKVFPREAPYMECVKKMKGLDSLVTNTIFVGTALALRGLLYDALAEVMKERVPLAFELIKTSHAQYRTSIFPVTAFNEHEELAADCGILYTNADPSLKDIIVNTMHTSGDDGTLWELLPFAYAATFLSPVWKEAAYKSGFEAHSNNAHCMIPAIETLIINLQSATLKGVAGDERKIQVCLQKFVEFSSIILLKLNNDIPPSKELPSMFIFLDKFVQRSRLLTMNVLENCVPYALLRSLYLQLYDVMGEQRHDKKKREAEDKEGEEN